MKILKVAVGNSNEAFIEDKFTEGLNIISSDDNNKGKSGGARVIYVDFITLDRTYLLTVYPKSKKETLTQSEIKYIKTIKP